MPAITRSTPCASKPDGAPGAPSSAPTRPRSKRASRTRSRIDKASHFIGRDALLRQQAEGLKKRLLLFTFDDPAAFPWGGEPISMNGQNVGELTSAGYSRKHGRAVAMGYARGDRVLSDAALLAARYQVDIAGELFAVTPHLKPA